MRSTKVSALGLVALAAVAGISMTRTSGSASAASKGTEAADTLYSPISVVFEASSDATSKDVPLKFVAQKTGWNDDWKFIAIWGRVENSSGVAYRLVAVTFTAYDSKGKFLGRVKMPSDPMDLGAGQVGYLNEVAVLCEKTRPSKIEFKVTGETAPR